MYHKLLYLFGLTTDTEQKTRCDRVEAVGDIVANFTAIGCGSSAGQTDPEP